MCVWWGGEWGFWLWGLGQCKLPATSAALGRCRAGAITCWALTLILAYKFMALALGGGNSPPPLLSHSRSTSPPSHSRPHSHPILHTRSTPPLPPKNQPPSGPPPDKRRCRAGAITCWDLTLILAYIFMVLAVGGAFVYQKRLRELQDREAELFGEWKQAPPPLGRGSRWELGSVPVLTQFHMKLQDREAELLGKWIGGPPPLGWG